MARFRREGNLPPVEVRETAIGWAFIGAAFPRAAVAFVAVAALVLASRPLDDLRGPRPVTAPPPLTLASLAPAVEDLPPAVTVPSVARRVAPARRMSAVIRLAVPRSLPEIPRPIVRLVLRLPADLPPIAWRTIILALETTRAPLHAGLTLQTQ